MKIIYDQNFDGLNFKVYYNISKVELYLYIDNEMMSTPFYTWGSYDEELFKILILKLLPEYLTDLIPTSLDIIANNIMIVIYNYFYGNMFLFEGLDLKYSNDVRDFLQECFNKYVNNTEYQYSDNFRYCIKNNIDELKEYNRLKSKGCCGFLDITVNHKGIDYMIGFNYGH